MREIRELEPLACVAERLARLLNFEERFIMRFASTDFFQERQQLGVDRNHKPLIGLVPVNNNALGFQIDIAPFNRCGLGLAYLAQSGIHEITVRLRVRIEPLGANVGHDRAKLLEVRRLPDRFLALLIFQIPGRTFEDHAISDRQIQRRTDKRQRRIYALALK